MLFVIVLLLTRECQLQLHVYPCDLWVFPGFLLIKKTDEITATISLWPFGLFMVSCYWWKNWWNNCNYIPVTFWTFHGIMLLMKKLQLYPCDLLDFSWYHVTDEKTATISLWLLDFSWFDTDEITATISLWLLVFSWFVYTDEITATISQWLLDFSWYHVTDENLNGKVLTRECQPQQHHWLLNFSWPVTDEDFPLFHPVMNNCCFLIQHLYLNS
jgi:hypothetical protein